MTETLTVINERVDDIPVLQAHMQRMELSSLLDTHFAPHGNWAGLSLGWVATIWLSHILSEGDHRLNQVELWVEKRLRTLRRSIRQPVQVLDFTDDRLAGVLQALSDDARWQAFESALNGHLLRVYDLNPQRVRLDSTSASGYWTVSEAGLFQFGHSKDHRPDLPQVKVLLATLDPLGLPLAAEVVPGERADDPLYLPAIQRVRASLGRRGLLYVGDCKMAALETRATIHAGTDFYLCPLPAVQVPPEELDAYLQPVWSGEQPLLPVFRESETGEREQIAEGYERCVTLTAQVAGQGLTWTERRLVIRSLAQAQAAATALRARLTKAVAALHALNAGGRGKKRFTDVEALRQAAEAVVVRYGVQGLVRLSYTETATVRPLRHYGLRPATAREKRQIQVTVAVDEVAVQAAVQRLGWRVYATNQPVEQFSLEQAVLAYRSEYLIERSFGRLKGCPLSLTPMYLQRDDHATGLIRLLSIGLRVLTLLEFVVRSRLMAEKAKLAGLYAGNPKRVTARPTAERLLEAFQEITLTVIQQGHEMRYHLTPLSALQKRILDLLGFAPDIYTRLCTNSAEPP